MLRINLFLLLVLVVCFAGSRPSIGLLKLFQDLESEQGGRASWTSNSGSFGWKCRPGRPTLGSSRSPGKSYACASPMPTARRPNRRLLPAEGGLMVVRRRGHAAIVMPRSGAPAGAPGLALPPGRIDPRGGLRDWSPPASTCRSSIPISCRGRASPATGAISKCPPPGGKIVDRNGDLLAVSTPMKSIWAIPVDARQMGLEQRPKLAGLLEMPSRELDSRLAERPLSS